MPVKPDLLPDSRTTTIGAQNVRIYLLRSTPDGPNSHAECRFPVSASSKRFVGEYGLRIWEWNSNRNRGRRESASLSTTASSGPFHSERHARSRRAATCGRLADWTSIQHREPDEQYILRCPRRVCSPPGEYCHPRYFSGSMKVNF